MNKLLTIALMFKVLDSATAPVRRINDTVGNTGRELEKAAGKSGQLKSGIDRIGAAAAAAAGKLDGLNKKTEKFAQAAEKLDGVGRPLAAGGAIGAIGIEKTLAAFSDLEAAQTSLQVAMMQKGGVVNRVDYAAMDALAQRLGKDYMGSAEDFYKMFRILQEQGIKVKDILAGTGQAVADFAAVTGEDYNNAALKIAKFQDSFGIAAKDMVEFTNQASKAKFAFGIDTTEIFYAMPYLGGSLKQLNMQGIGASDSILRLMGILNQAGLPASQVGESLNQMINRMADFDTRLGKNSKIMKEVRAALKGTGIEMDFWTKEGKFAGIENMIKQFEKMKGLSEQDRIKVGKALFGDVASKAVSILAIKGMAGWEEAKEVMRKQADQSERVAKIRQNLAFKWDSFTGTIKGFVAVTGEAINRSTGLKSILDRLNDTFDAAKNWILLHPKTAAIIAAVAVSITGLSLAGGALLLTLAGLGAAWPRALEGLSTIGKGAAWATGRVTALYLAMRRKWVFTKLPSSMFGDVIPGAAKAQTSLRGLAATMGGRIVSGFRAAALAARAFAVAIIANPIGILIAALIAALGLLIFTYWNPIKAFFGGMWQGIKEGLSPLKEVWKSFTGAAKSFSPLINLIKQFLTPLGFTEKQLSSVAWWGKAIGYGLTVAFTTPIYALVGFIKKVKELLFNTKQFFQGGWNWVKSIGAGILAGISHPVEAIKSVATRIRRFLPFSPAKEGPLRDIHRIRLVETIADSIKPGPMVNAMRGATAATLLAVSPISGLAHAATGGGMTITFAPQITVQGGGDPAQIRGAVDQAMSISFTEFERLMQRYEGQKQRRGF